LSESGFLPKNRAELQDNHSVFNESVQSLETGNSKDIGAFEGVCYDRTIAQEQDLNK